MCNILFMIWWIENQQSSAQKYMRFERNVLFENMQLYLHRRRRKQKPAEKEETEKVCWTFFFLRERERRGLRTSFKIVFVEFHRGTQCLYSSYIGFFRIRRVSQRGKWKGFWKRCYRQHREIHNRRGGWGGRNPWWLCYPARSVSRPE